MAKEVELEVLLGNYFSGVITKNEMRKLVKIFRNDVERAKKEVLQEVRLRPNVPEGFFKKFNSNAVKIFDYSLQKIYKDNVYNYDMIEFVYNNIKKDLSRLASSKDDNTNF